MVYRPSGVGIGCAHYGVEVPKGDPGKAMHEWIGGYYEHAFSVNPMWSPEFKSFPDHPVTRGVKPFSVVDEWYFNMRFREDTKGLTHILVAKPSDQVRNGPYVFPKGPYPHIQEAKGRDEMKAGNTAAAFLVFRRAAEAGNPAAQVELVLGHHLELALGAPADEVGQLGVGARQLETLLQRLAPGQPPGRQALGGGQELHWQRQRLWLA